MKMSEMIEKRKKGATYQEIADDVGLSKQRVNKIVTEHAPELKGMRGNRFDIERIIYKGIYDYFKSHPYESLSSFVGKIYGYTGNEISTIRDFITGAHTSRLTIERIRKICEITGKTFEELFELRGGNG